LNLDIFYKEKAPARARAGVLRGTLRRLAGASRRDAPLLPSWQMPGTCGGLRGDMP